MALEDILEIIAADAEQEATAILNAANAAYEKRLEEAHERAAAIREQILAEAKRTAQQQKARRLHRAGLEILREQVQVQETAFLAAVRRAEELLAAARERPDYPDIMADLVSEALAQHDGPATLHVHPDDEPLVHSLLQEMDSSTLQLTTDPQMAPGVAVLSQDGRIRIENTLESRLQHALPDLRPLLSDLLGREDPAARRTHAGPD